jgi:hypothetical protein
MHDCGLHAAVDYDEFQLAFGKQRYLEMIRNRYMSLLSEFDDSEIEQGIAEIDQNYPDDLLEFPDRFAFVLGILE